MNLLTRFAARLYPRSWRERYGSEFDALLEVGDSNWGAALNVVMGAISMQIRAFRFGWIGVGALAGTTLAILASFASPLQFKPKAIILVDAYAATGADELVTSDYLDRVDRFVDPKRINLRIVKNWTRERPGAFEVSVADPDPTIASKLTNRVVSTIIDNNMLSHAEGKTQSRFRMITIDYARLPDHPDYTPRIRICIAGLIAGFLLGLMLAIIRRVPKPA